MGVDRRPTASRVTSTPSASIVLSRETLSSMRKWTDELAVRRLFSSAALRLRSSSTKQPVQVGAAVILAPGTLVHPVEPRAGRDLPA